MAFNAQYIAPVNLNPNIGLGVQIPFSNPGIFTSIYNTQEAVKNNMINYFLTEPGELPLNPSFGGGLRRFLFDQISPPTVDGLRNYMQSKLNTVFPMVEIDSLEVLTNQQDYNSITIQLKYYIPNSNISGVLNFQF
jgi:phage baseplate assembly protein W